MIRLVAILALLLPARAAPAGIVTIEFEGVVAQTLPSYLPVLDDFDILPDIGLGDPFSGAYTYDDSVAPQAPPFCDGPCGAVYAFRDLPGESMHLEIAGTSYFFDRSSGPTPSFSFPLFDGLSVGLSTGEFPQPVGALDTYIASWSGSSSQDGDTQITENLVQLALRFPAGTLVPSPLPSAPITLDPLLVPDLEQAVHPFDEASFVFVRRSEYTPQSVEFVNGRPIITPAVSRASRFVGEITSLTLLPEPRLTTVLGPLLFLLLAREVRRR